MSDYSDNDLMALLALEPTPISQWHGPDITDREARRVAATLEREIDGLDRIIERATDSHVRNSAIGRRNRRDGELAFLWAQINPILFDSADASDPLTDYPRCRAEACPIRVDRAGVHNRAGYCHLHFLAATGAAPTEQVQRVFDRFTQR